MLMRSNCVSQPKALLAVSVTIELAVIFGVPLLIDPFSDDQAGKPATPNVIGCVPVRSIE